MATTFEETYLLYASNTYTASGGVDGYKHTGGASNSVFDYFSDTPSVGDVFEFKMPEPISGVKLEIGTAMDGTGVIIWEYAVFNNAWQTLRVENGDAVKSIGTQIVKWTPPSDWTAYATNARPPYKIRMRLTDVTGITEGGANATNVVEKLMHSFDTIGTGLSMSTVNTYDLATPYTMLSAITPAASLSPIECTFKKSGIVGKLDVTLAGCTVGAGDTVVLTGIDYDDAALVETLDVSGSGTATYTTVNCFKDVTDVACTGFNDGTIKLETKRIGLVQKNIKQFDMYTCVIIGDNSTVTTFSETFAVYNFQYVSTRFLGYGADTTITFGTLESTGDVSHAERGVYIYFGNLIGKSGTANCGGYNMRLRVSNGATIYFYGVKMQYSNTYNDNYISFLGGIYYAQNFEFDNYRTVILAGTWVTVDGFWAATIYAGGGLPNFTNTPANVIFNKSVSLTNNRDGRYSAWVLKDSYIEGFSDVNNYTDVNRQLNFIDCSNLTTTNFTTTSRISRQVGKGIYLIKTFNLKVIDSTGTAIETATVTMDDKDGTEVFSTTTDASGDIVEQEITWYHGLWITTSPYGIDWTLYTPHTVTISKTGYATRTIIYTMDRKIEEVEKLTVDGTNIQDAVLYDTTIY